MDEINAIAARHGNIPVIEDAAQSFGAAYRAALELQRLVARLHQLLPEQAAGLLRRRRAIFTSDDALARPREIRVHGPERGATTTRASASAGAWTRCSARWCWASFERFDWELERRALGDRCAPDRRPPGLQRQRAWRCATTGLRLGPVHRAGRAPGRGAEGAAGRRIPTAVHPKPLHHQPAFAAGRDAAACPHSIRAAQRAHEPADERRPVRRRSGPWRRHWAASLPGAERDRRPICFAGCCASLTLLAGGGWRSWCRCCSGP